MPRPRRFLAGLVIPAAALTAACSVSSPPAKDPNRETQAVSYQQGAAYAEPPQQPVAMPTSTASGRFEVPGLVEVAPRNVPEAVSQLDRAEQLVGFVLAPSPPGDVDAQGAMRKAPSAGTSGAPVPLGDPCLIACAALASMKRSADHVCTMAGDGDEACGSARARVQRAEQRVLAACPACASSARSG